MHTLFKVAALLVGTLALSIFLPLAIGQRTIDQATTPSITVANYELAEARLQRNIVPKVKNLFVLPHWIDQSDYFWYARQNESGIEYTIVDAATGKKRAAFDHEKLAEILAKNDVNANSVRLMLSNLKFDAELHLTSFRMNDETFLINWDKATTERQPAEPALGLVVSPNGKFGIRSQDGNLILRNMLTGDEIALTSDGTENNGYGIYYGNWKAAYIPRLRTGQPQPPLGCEWAPDSRHILALKIDQSHVAPYPFLETVPNDGSFRPIVHQPRIPLTGEEPAKAEWYVFDLEQRTSQKILLPYDQLFHVHQDMLAIRKTKWSSDCKRLYAVTWGSNLESAQLYDVDVASGAARAVVHEAMSPRTDLNSTSYNPPNVHVVGDGTEAIWFSQRDGWGHLYLYNGKDGNLTGQITEGQWLVRDLIHVDEANRVIYFTAGGLERGNPYYRYLYRINFDGTGMKLLSPEPADHMLTGMGNDVLPIDGALGYDVVSPSRKYVVYNYSTINQPTKTAIRRTDDGSLVDVFESADATALYASGWEDPEEVVTFAADGKTKLYGLLYKPHDFDPGLKYPVIDSQYASPLTAVVPRNFMMAIAGVPAIYHPSSLAALGFVGVAIDARGTTYRSKEFSHYSNKNLNTIGLEDHVAAIKELAQTRPWMDIDRVGVHGASYGGFTTFRAMFEFPEFYKVGISGCGVGSIHNMYPDYHWEAFHGKVVYADGSSRRPTPTDRPINYENNDSSIQAKNLRGKLLIMMGELDENVLPATTLGVVDSLIKLDKDFDMLYVPNRPHNFVSRHVIRRGWDYFVQHLHGVEPPAYEIRSMETEEEKKLRLRVGADKETSQK